MQLPPRLQRFIEFIFRQFHNLTVVNFGVFIVLVFITLYVTEVAVVAKLTHVLLRLWVQEFS